jgi:hypothetical protein
MEKRQGNVIEMIRDDAAEVVRGIAGHVQIRDKKIPIPIIVEWLLPWSSFSPPQGPRAKRNLSRLSWAAARIGSGMGLKHWGRSALYSMFVEGKLFQDVLSAAITWHCVPEEYLVPRSAFEKEESHVAFPASSPEIGVSLGKGEM